MSGHLHLIKLSVGSTAVEDLANWQVTVRERNAAAGFGPIVTHTTRMWPKREAELVDGGSLYWVIKGVVLVRQPILELQERVGQDGIRRCAIVLAPELVRTQPQPRRAFQGWRYLKAADAPPDLGPFRMGEESLPASLASELASLGVL